MSIEAAPVDFCMETFHDALTWSKDRRDREVRGYCEQLNALYDRTRPELTDCIIREMRAIKLANRCLAL